MRNRTSRDPFNADGDEVSKGTYEARAGKMGESLLDRFRANMDGAGVLDVIRIKQGYSQDFVSKFSEPVDMVVLQQNRRSAGPRAIFASG